MTSALKWPRGVHASGDNSGIVADNLVKVFQVRKKRKGSIRPARTEVTAVNGLSMHIPRGQITGLLGLNGAGKTTTIKMLATLLLPTSGSISLDGMDVTSHAAEARKRVNLIAGAERMVYARLTAVENLLYFGRLYNVPRETLRSKIKDLLDLVGLDQASDTKVEQYSKGMKQRLSIARGLINDPDCLFLDEPTLGLDAPIARELRRVVAGLAAGGKAVLLTSHYLAEVEELCDNVYVIDHGREVAHGTPRQLTAMSGQQVKIRVAVTDEPQGAESMRVEQALKELSRTAGATVQHMPGPADQVFVFSHRDNLAGQVVAALGRSGATVSRLEITEPSLEDAIVKLGEQAKGS